MPAASPGGGGEVGILGGGALGEVRLDEIGGDGRRWEV
jgi:hypothetical protein